MRLQQAQCLVRELSDFFVTAGGRNVASASLESLETLWCRQLVFFGKDQSTSARCVASRSLLGFVLIRIQRRLKVHELHVATVP